MDGVVIVQIVGLLFALLVQTAIFFYKVGAAKETIISEINAKITIIKTAIDLEIDGLRSQVHEHRLLVAERYLNRDDFRSAIDELKRTNELAFSEVKQAIKELRISRE